MLLLVVSPHSESTVGEIYNFLEMDNKTQGSGISDQLIIDLNDSNTDNAVNFNNNSLMQTANLVTPDSHHDNNGECRYFFC